MFLNWSIIFFSLLRKNISLFWTLGKICCSFLSSFLLSRSPTFPLWHPITGHLLIRTRFFHSFGHKGEFATSFPSPSPPSFSHSLIYTFFYSLLLLYSLYSSHLIFPFVLLSSLFFHLHYSHPSTELYTTHDLFRSSYFLSPSSFLLLSSVSTPLISFLLSSALSSSWNTNNSPPIPLLL